MLRSCAACLLLSVVLWSGGCADLASNAQPKAVDPILPAVKDPVDSPAQTQKLIGHTTGDPSTVVDGGNRFVARRVPNAADSFPRRDLSLTNGDPAAHSRGGLTSASTAAKGTDPVGLRRGRCGLQLLRSAAFRPSHPVLQP
jgi:hypothetical protein